MKIKLAFDDWRKDNKSIYNTEKGIDLSVGQFHSGTVFDAEVDLDAISESQLRKAIEDGYELVFSVFLGD